MVTEYHILLLVNGRFSVAHRPQMTPDQAVAMARDVLKFFGAGDTAGTGVSECAQAPTDG